MRLSEFGDLFIQNENDNNLVTLIYKAISKDAIVGAVEIIRKIAKPNHDKYYDELLEQYNIVRRFLPTLLNTLKLQATKEGKPAQKVMEFLAKK